MPDDMRLNELLEFTAKNGIPDDARFRAAIEWDDDYADAHVELRWYVPAKKEHTP
jgi:hypothetical protein